MNTYTLINDRDGNDTIDIEADTLIDAAIDGLSQLGWSMSSDDSSEFRVAKAAPELLEALRDCITSEGAACFGQMEKHPEWMQRRLYAISDIARAAIAKAEGRAE